MCYSTPSAVVVSRATPTKLEVDGRGWKFNREGRERGSRYSDIRIFAVTAEKMAEEIQEKNDKDEFVRLRHSLDETKWRNFTLDQLRQVSALVESFKAADPQS
jgi:hypothetical protein